MRRVWALILSLALVLGPYPVLAQEEGPEGPAETETVDEAAEDVAEETAEESEEGKELKWGGTPYAYTGPDTGFGIGFAILYRDMFGKKGRDTDFSFTLTQSEKQSFSLTWQEPYFLSDRGRLKISTSYTTEPSIRFYGIGNDRPLRGSLSNYFWRSFSIGPTYIYRFPKTDYGIFGVRFGVSYELIDPDNGKLDDPDLGSYNRTVEEAYPEIYNSFHFENSVHIIPSVTAYRDTRIDRFPLGGGREEVVWPMRGGYEEVSYSRSDEAWGSDFSYQRFTLDVRRYFPLFSEDTIVAIRGKASLGQGEVPFYKMVSYGNGSDLRGYYGNRFLDKSSTQYNIELRQGFLPNAELPILGGLIKLKYPSVALFWDSARVYEDIEDIPEEWLEDYHYTYGFAFRFVITPSVVIRAEWGYSDEQNTFSVNTGLPI